MSEEEMMTCRLPTEMKARVERLAKKRYCSAASIVKCALSEYLEKEEPKAEYGDEEED